MNVYLHLKIVGAILLVLGLAHACFDRYFRWQSELAKLTVLTRQVFAVHNFFIGLLVAMMGICSLFFTKALVASGTLSCVVLSGFVLTWLCRWVVQLFVYDPSIWRGRRFYSVMHVAFTLFWTYIVIAYSAALRLAWQA